MKTPLSTLSLKHLRRLGILTVLILAGLAFALSTNGQDVARAAPSVSDAQPDDIITGKPEALITVVEYASLTCPHCAHFHTEILPEFHKRYIETGKVKLINRDFPLNEPALKAAMLVRCADVSKKHAFMNVLFGSQDKWAFSSDYMASLATIAALGGMPKEKLDACLSDTNIEKAVLESRKHGEGYGVSSTPTFFVNDQKVSGVQTIEELVTVIDPLLEKPANP